MSTWKHVRAILAGPFAVIVLIPALLVVLTGRRKKGRLVERPPGLLRGIGGVALMVLGMAILSRSIALFARVGEGTLAPWDPTKRLVVVGLYRYVRNPMYVGVMLALMGEVVLVGSLALAAWALYVFAAFNAFVLLHEEPTLRRKYGEQYAEYARNVPRWLPRRLPWAGGGNNGF